MAVPRFEDLTPGLSSEALLAIESFGFQYTTPVQAATIPLFLSHKDVCVQATTGSGKTIAFGIPIFEILNRRSEFLKKYEIGALVIAPTRELASQIFTVLSQISESYHNLICALFVGGTDINDTYSILEEKGAQVIVGTPGRVLDIFNRNRMLVLKELEVLVLDEADTLLDMGFRQTINQILSMLPKQRRTGLFSATQTQELRELAIAGMRNPVTIAVTIKSTPQSADEENPAVVAPVRNIPTTLRSYFSIAPYDKRLEILLQFLSKYSQKKIIVFVSTCSCVDYYTMALNKLKAHQSSSSEASLTDLPSNIFVTGLHGKMVPKKRSILYQKFVSCDHSKTAVMFCTDVAARGIDIPDVDWIIQLTAPKDPSFFIHRIGRTARAGREGNALIFVTEEERPYIELLRGRGVPMNEMTWEEPETDSSPQDPLTVIRTLCHTDRELLESGTTAFISFIRAYKENLCSYIFRMDQLAIGDVARSYSLLKLPKIAETVKYKSRIQFEEAQDIDTSTIPYLHKEKEAARQRKLQNLKTSKVQTPEQSSTPSAKSKTKIEESSLKAKAQELESNKRKRKKRQGLHSKIMNEWEELAAEETIYKKLRKGKITQDIYDEALTGDDILEIDDVIALGNQQKKRKIQEDDDDSVTDDGDEDREDCDSDTSMNDKKQKQKQSYREMKQNKILLKQQKAELRAKRFVGTIRQPKKQEHVNHRKLQQKKKEATGDGQSGKMKNFRKK